MNQTMLLLMGALLLMVVRRNAMGQRQQSFQRGFGQFGGDAEL
jgi:glutamine amidotransferase PdxT